MILYYIQYKKKSLSEIQSQQSKTKSEKIKSSEDIQINHDLLIHNLYVLLIENDILLLIAGIKII